jgi:hypothetical protein
VQALCCCVKALHVHVLLVVMQEDPGAGGGDGDMGSRAGRAAASTRQQHMSEADHTVAHDTDWCRKIPGGGVASTAGRAAARTKQQHKSEADAGDSSSSNGDSC